MSALQAPENVERLRAIMNHKVSQPTDLEPQIKLLTRQLADLDRKIQAGVARVVEVPDHMLEDVYSHVGELKTQRSTVEAELAALKSRKPAGHRAFTVEQVLEKIGKMASELESLDPQKVQRVLSALIERVSLRFETVQHGKRRIQRLAGGDIHLTERQMAGTRFDENLRLLPCGEFKVAV